MTKASPREAAVATPVQSESLFNKGFHARNPSEQDVLDFVDAQDAITGVRSNPEASGYPGGFRFKRIENIQIVKRTSARPLNVALTRVFSAFVDANYAILNPREYVKNLVPREMPDTTYLSYDPATRVVSAIHFRATDQQVNAELAKRGKQVRAGHPSR